MCFRKAGSVRASTIARRMAGVTFSGGASLRSAPDAVRPLEGQGALVVVVEAEAVDWEG
uniref:Uncharacterized protein n=1 Tax=Solanum lycopersicum TaxID=4081 RepID=A0A494G9Z8_SOLLC